MIHILSTTLETLGVIDDYYSLIWTERHHEAGDFEVELPIIYNDNPIIASGNLVRNTESNVLMLIEGLKPSKDSDQESLIVTGQSVESLIGRRYILTPIDVSGSAETSLYNVVMDNCVTPTDTNRTIDLLAGTTPVVTLTPNHSNQFDIQSVYDICVTISKDTGLGFEVVLDTAVAGQMKFQVYEGIDRSAAQSVLPRVIFSTDFDNIITGSFYIDDKQVSVVQVLTDDLTFPTTTVWLGGGPVPSDLARYEQVLETSIDREIDEGNPLTNAEVYAIIQTRGKAVIRENQPKGLFEGDFDIQGNFKYGVDFFMGDIVQVFFAGRDTPARVIELVRSYSVEGITTYVTMDFIDIPE